MTSATSDQQVPLRVQYASPPLTTSQKIASSTWHRERAIIAVWSHLPIKCSHERKNDLCACARTKQNNNETKCIDIETIVETKR